MPRFFKQQIKYLICIAILDFLGLLIRNQFVQRCIIIICFLFDQSSDISLLFLPLTNKLSPNKLLIASLLHEHNRPIIQILLNYSIFIIFLPRKFLILSYPHISLPFKYSIITNYSNKNNRLHLRKFHKIIRINLNSYTCLSFEFCVGVIFFTKLCSKGFDLGNLIFEDLVEGCCLLFSGS